MPRFSRRLPSVISGVGTSTAVEQQMRQHGFPPDKRGHLQIRLVVDQAVQRVLNGLPAAFVRGFIHMEGQAGCHIPGWRRFPAQTGRDAPRSTPRPTGSDIPDTGRDVWVFAA